MYELPEEIIGYNHARYTHTPYLQGHTHDWAGKTNTHPVQQNDCMGHIWLSMLEVKHHLVLRTPKTCVVTLNKQQLIKSFRLWPIFFSPYNYLFYILYLWQSNYHPYSLPVNYHLFIYMYLYLIMCYFCSYHEYTYTV